MDTDLVTAHRNERHESVLSSRFHLSSSRRSVYYITYVFQMAGYTGNATLLSSSIQYIINVFLTIPALIWMDRWGRRPMLLFGALFMAAFMYANAGILGAHAKIIPEAQRSSPEVSMSVSGPASKGLIACTYLFVAYVTLCRSV